jgi:hypothetical protein
MSKLLYGHQITINHCFPQSVVTTLLCDWRIDQTLRTGRPIRACRSS